MKSQMNRLFVESLVPHLELATRNELNWEGIVRHNIQRIGDSIVQEAITQKAD